MFVWGNDDEIKLYTSVETLKNLEEEARTLNAGCAYPLFLKMYRVHSDAEIPDRYFAMSMKLIYEVHIHEQIFSSEQAGVAQ